MENIRHRIRALRHRNIAGKWFIPDGSLLSELPCGIIKSSLQSYCDVEPYGVEWMSQAIQDGARKVFAILILIRQERKISTFFEKYLQSDDQKLDSRLPFSGSELNQVFTQAVACEFEEQQWDFTAPVFNHRLLHRNIPTEFPLPFIESKKLGRGGFGDVYEIVVIAGHHDFKDLDSTKNARIVRKELREGLGDGDLWTQAGSNEHQIMSYLYHLGHPNILPLLTSYTYNGVPNFLMPLAEGGDLEHLLNLNSRPKEFVKDANLYNALSGLASGLETLHRYKSDILGTEMIGYHHDLKPKNVLLTRGRFVLSDFGLSKLKTGEDSRTPFKVGQGHYLAPECEDPDSGFSKGFISRASDVWSLGCIMLEVIVFMVGGSDALSEFRKNRKFKRGIFTTTTFFCSKSVNPAVEHKMSELAECESIAVRKAVTLIRQILVIDFGERLKASEIALKLRLISFEAFYLRLCAAFQTTEWRINNSEVLVAWNRVYEMTQNLALGDNMVVFESLKAEDLGLFTNHTRVEKLLGAIESLLNLMEFSELSTDVAPGILSNLQQLEYLLNPRFSSSQSELDIEDSTEIGPNSGTPRPTESDHVQKLAWNDYSVAAETRAPSNATISQDGRFLAAEYAWQITIYALPSGEKIQEISVPDDMQKYRPRFLVERYPELRFLPKGDCLIVLWGINVYSHSIGHNQTKSSLIFSQLPSEIYNFVDRNKIQGHISLAAISPNSKKVAIKGSIASRSSGWEYIIYVVDLTDSGAATGKPRRIIIYQDDCVFAFSPDGRQLATTDKRIRRRDQQQNEVLIRFIDISQDEYSSKWFTLCWNKEPNGRERPGCLTRLRDQFSTGRSCRLIFSVWRNRWVAIVWDPFTCTFVRYDLSSPKIGTALGLSSLETLIAPTKNLIFSGNLKLAASYGSPTGAIFLRKFMRSGDKKISDSLVAVADVETNKVICVLQCSALDHCWLSDSGEYAVMRKKKELRVFQVQRD